MKPGKHYVLEGRFQTGRVEGFYDPVDNVWDMLPILICILMIPWQTSSMPLL